MLRQFDPARWQFDWLAAGEAALVLAVAIALALAGHALLFAVMRRVTARSASPFDDIFVRAMRRPMRWAAVALAISLAAQSKAVASHGLAGVIHFIAPALFGWVAYAVVKGLEAGFVAVVAGAEDPVAQRGRLTRVAILARTARFVIVLVAVALMLMAVPGVRDIGTTMLASAGLAALAVGAAAQPALKSLIAGLQMALTQPLRLGDLVKIDGQTGRVEEIRMSFITVRTWDERVLVVPTARVLDNSFENWSRVSERLSGAVMLYLEPGSAIAPIRDEYERFVRAHPLFDGRTVALLMTDARPGSIELRLAMSAATIGALFDLRCAVREHMLEWLGEHQPGALLRHPVPGDEAPPPA